MLIDRALVSATLGAFIGILFLYSGLIKLTTIRQFTNDLLQLRYIPQKIAGGLAISIGGIELLTGSFAFLGYLWARIVLIILLTAFACVGVAVHWTKQRIPCNCFGAQRDEYLSSATAVRNLLLVGIVAVQGSASALPSVLVSIYGFIAFQLFLATRLVIKTNSDASDLHRKVST